MITRSIRKSLKRKEGQALVIACLMMLIVAIAVLTTVNLGHSIGERMRLQNTADAAAYSTAAMEARAFNFYAFSNRTQVSHYVQAMNWQAFNSFIYFVEAFATDVFGFVLTLAICESTSNWVIKAACEAVVVIPVIGQIIKAILNVIKAVVKILTTVVSLLQKGIKLSKADEIFGEIIPQVHNLNAAMAAMQQVVMYSLLTRLVQGSKDLINENDPNIKSGLPWQLAAGALSACMFDRAHFAEANGAPFRALHNPLTPLNRTLVSDRKKVTRAKTTFANITNATRYACDSGGGLCPANALTSSQIGDTLKNALNLPDWAAPVTDLINDALDKHGQTRLLGFKQTGLNAKNGPRNYIQLNQGNWNRPVGMTATGDNLATDDDYRFGMGPDDLLGAIDNPFACGENDIGKKNECWGNAIAWDDGKDAPERRHKVSIWALNDAAGEYRYKNRTGGVHWRLDWATIPYNKYKSYGIARAKICLLDTPLGCVPGAKIEVFNAWVGPVADGNHSWKGIMPFSHFEPGQYNGNCAEDAVSRDTEPKLDTAAGYNEEFNQPSTWSVLTKNHKEMKNPAADPAGPGTNSPALVTPDGKLTLGLSGSGTTLEMDNTRKNMVGFDAGLVVISRAQVYYHRPGVWSEQPNFFNPYWRPRLASVWQGRRGLPLVQRVMDALPKSVQNAPQKLLTH